MLIMLLDSIISKKESAHDYRFYVQDLAEICRVNAKEMLQSQWGTEVIYEVLLELLPACR